MNIHQPQKDMHLAAHTSSHKTKMFLGILLGLIVGFILGFLASWLFFVKPMQPNMMAFDALSELNVEEAVIAEDATSSESIMKDPCSVDYESTEESQVVSEESYAFVTGFDQKCDGYYYVTLDYIVSAPLPPNASEAINLQNANPRERTFRMNASEVSITDNQGGMMSLDAFLGALQVYPHENPLSFGTTYWLGDNLSSGIYNVTIEEGEVINIRELYIS